MPPNAKPSRPMTFTGCWTCKARKVRCDERRVACRNCEKKGVVCGGYGVRLQWISEQLEPSPPGPSKVQGRRAIPLVREHQYGIGEIDDFLTGIEEDSVSRLTSTRGPFAFFPHQTISNRAARLATSSSITAASSSRNRGVIVTLPDQPNFENLVHHLSDYYPVSDGSVSTLASRSASLSPDRLLLRSIRVSIFGNRAVDMLMHHYLVHVADLLVPVVHSRNTFRDLYFPGAVRGAVIHQTIANDLQTQTQSTLYHSVLAAAAFHLWNCQRGTSQYRDIALQHKSRALGFLQAAVNHAAPNANNEDLIIAMLSLVTIGVISGDEDFVVHFSAVAQLRRLHKLNGVSSNITHQLDEISAFLTLMTRTLTFECQSTLTLLGAGVGSQDDSQILESNQSYGHMYGITTNIVTSIQEICRLGEILSQVKDGDLTLILDDVLIDCQTLGDELRSWSLDAEPSKPILNGSELMLSIFRHQATAWYHGALIYYYHRIQGYRGSELVRDVDQVLAHMDAAEDTKDSAKPGTLGRLAPITWPMFIASCEAVGPRRVSCERWWLRIEHYKIANTRKQWVTIQQIWQGLDTAHTAGCSSSDWIEVYKGLDVSILPM